MTSRDFCYWLQGALELHENKGMTIEQMEVVRRHLAMVFVHEIDPSFPAEQQTALTETHQGEPLSRYANRHRGVDDIVINC